MTELADVAVIGAGVVGLGVARRSRAMSSSPTWSSPPAASRGLECTHPEARDGGPDRPRRRAIRLAQVHPTGCVRPLRYASSRGGAMRSQLDFEAQFASEADCLQYLREMRCKISEAAAQVLLRYHWPGNVRELRNVIRRAILLAADVIEPAHLSVIPVDSPATAALREAPAPADCSLKEIADAAAAQAEQDAIRRVLQLTSGNKSEAARLLRTDYKTLYLKMKQYRIDAGQFRGFRA